MTDDPSDVQETPIPSSGPASAPIRQAVEGLTVLQVIPALDAGGAEQTTLDVAAAIVAAGGRALVATEGGRLASAIEAAGGEIVPLPVATKNPYGMLSNIARLSHLITGEGVDIVHVRSRAPAWSALAAAQLCRKPLVTTYHGTYNARSGMKRFYNSGMARGDVVIANSHFIAAHVAEHYPWTKERILTIPRGMSMQVFDPDAVDTSRVAAVRRSWGLSEHAGMNDPAIVLLPGRLTRWKGQQTLVEAAHMLEGMGFSGDYLCVLPGDAQGRNAYVSELKSRIAELSLGERVRLVGHCADMPAAYLASDIVVSASTDPEAFGRVAVEAQAMRRPIVATDHGGSRETIVPYGEELATGWRVPPGDPGALAAALSAALALGPDGRTQMGVLGRLHVRETYDLTTMCGATLRVYGALRAGLRGAEAIAAARSGALPRQRVLLIDLEGRALAPGWSRAQGLGALSGGMITLLTSASRAAEAWKSGRFDGVWVWDGRPGFGALRQLRALARKHPFAQVLIDGKGSEAELEVARMVRLARSEHGAS